jgi:membrane protein implicated in regulation of membrane protease activity
MIIKKLLTWLPSITISLFYIPNALSKIFEANTLDKVVSNPLIIIVIGIVLLTANLLFLIPKTMILGTAILSLYMTCIVSIHMIKGKPHEVTILIVMATIFAAYLRNPSFFKIKKTQVKRLKSNI